MGLYLAALISITWFCAPVLAAPPLKFAVEDVVTGVEQPIGMKFLPDGRLLLLQKKGLIRVMNVSGNTNSEVYLDLSAAAHTDKIDADQERGLLDIALDPAFPAEPYIYLFYTPKFGTPAPRSRISRFTHVENSGGLTSRANPGSEVVLWQDSDGYDSCCHFGGGLDFGPDGNLWLTTGDHFQGSYAASLQKGGGKVIRIQKEGTIPPGNPFNDGAGPNFDSIFAYGLRNPFRARWDIPSGRFFIAEVGGNTQSIAWEDLHVIRYDAGSGRFIDADFGTPQDNGIYDGINFGWPDCEGLPPHTNFPDCNISAVAEPIFGYAHGGSFAAINGGIVYRGSLFPPEFQGAYFYADSTRDFVRYIRFNADGTVAPNPDPDPISPQNPDSISYPFDLAPVGRIVSMEVGPDGALYYISFTDSGGAYGQSNPTVLGSLRRYVYDDANVRPEITQLSAVPVTGPSPLMVEFTFQASDLEADSMTYVLHFGDGFDSGAPQPLPQGSPLTVAHTYATDGVYECTLEVITDSHTVAEAIPVSVGTPPQITSIIATNSRQGATEGMFRYGDVITFSAEASDVEDGTLTGASFSWSISFMRPGNTHPAFGPVTNVTSINFPVPEQGQGFSGPVFYRCFLTVTDSSGLTASTTIDIFPEKANITFDTVPSGISVQVNGNTTETTPFTLDTLISYPHTITVPDVRCLVGDEYTFSQWSNGETTSQIVYVVPETNSALTATYTLTGACELTPPDNGLVMHLKGTAGTVMNGQTVLNWQDQTPNANHLSAVGEPSLLLQELNGKDVVHFDGINDALARSGFTGLPTGGAARSLFMVARYNAPNANGAGWVGFAYGAAANNKLFGLALTPTGKLGVQGWGSGNDIATTADGVGQWFSQGAVYSAGSLTQFKNNVQIGAKSHTFSTGTSLIRLGEEANGGKNLNMDVAEILVYNRAVSTSERQQIQDYLEQRYLLSVEANLPPSIANFTAVPSSGTAPLNVEFQLTANDPESNPLTYLLSFGDGTATPTPVALTAGTPETIQHTYAEGGTYQAQVTVSDGRATVTSNIFITAGTAPIITSLVSTNSRAGSQPTSFRFGDTISFSASANDPEDGVLGATNFTWNVVFVNENGTYPVLGPVTNTETLEFSIPVQPQGFSGNCFYRGSLVVTDSSGLTATSHIDLQPEKVNITVDTVPSGIPLQVDSGAVLPTPFTIDTLIGYEHLLSALDTTCLQETQYVFGNWSNGELTPTVVIQAPETAANLVATYTVGGSCVNLPTAGLVMHLRADQGLVVNGSAVTGWEDQGPMGNHLTSVGAPTLLADALNGNDVVHFDGIDDALARTGFSGLPTGGSARSAFMVVRYNAVNANGSGWAGFAYGTTSNNKVFGLALSVNGNLGIQAWGSAYDIETTTPGVGQWLSHGAVYGGGVVTQYSNNILIGTKTRTFNTGTGSIRLGEEINGGKNLDMEVAEIVVYNRAVSEAEREQIQQYFKQRFALTEGAANPTLQLTTQLSGAHFTSDQAIVFKATASDAQDGDISSQIVWNSDVSGNLGTGASVTLNNPPIGTHQITASVTDIDTNVTAITNLITVTDAQAVTPTSPIALVSPNGFPEMYPYFSESGYSDPKGVFTMTNEVLQVTGEKVGALQTIRRYRDYQLVFEYKWGDRTWGSRVGKARDAGLLFHCNGANNGWDGIFMPGYQAQVMEGSSGDLLLLRGASTTGEILPLAMTVTREQVQCVYDTWNCAGGYRWNPAMPAVTMNANRDSVHWSQWDPAWQEVTGFRGAADVESPVGQWNQMVVVANGQTASIYLNGQKINEATGLSSTEGKIQIESELAEFFVRRLELLPLSANIPPVIITESLPAGIVGGSYSASLSGYGLAAPLSWSVVAGTLPGGVSLAPSGLISGTPTTSGSFGFTVQVSDAQSASAVKDFVINVTPEAPPLPTAGLVVQLESDLNVALMSDDLVAGWLDQSGLGNDLVAAGNPRLVQGATPSGLPAIVLDGNGDKLDRQNSTDPLGGLPGGNQNRTMFVVSKYNSASVWAGVSYGAAANNQTFGIIAKQTSGELVLQGYGKYHDLVTTASGVGAGWILQSAVLNDGVAAIYKNSIQVKQWSHIYDTSLSRFVIGQEIGNRGYVAMEIAAVLIYDRALSQAERDEVEEYLRNKYLIAPPLPPPPSLAAQQVAPLSGAVAAGQLEIRRTGDGEVEVEYSGPSIPGTYHLHMVTNLGAESLLEPESRVQSVSWTREHIERGEPLIFLQSAEYETMFFQIVVDPN